MIAVAPVLFLLALYVAIGYGASQLGLSGVWVAAVILAAIAATGALWLALRDAWSDGVG